MLSRLLASGLALVLVAQGAPLLAAPPADVKKAKDKKEEPASKPADLLKQALKAAEKEDYAGASALLEQALKLEPNHHEALFLLAQLSEFRAGQLDRPESSPYYLKAAELMRKLRKVSSQELTPQERDFLAQTLYNEACTLAVQHKTDQALQSLTDAVAAGFEDSETIASDKELDPLRSAPAFKDLAKKVEDKARATAQQDARDALAETKPFPFAFELPDVNGKKVSLASTRGKVTIVDIWGTWCPPCRAEIPHFIKLYDQYHDKGLEIIGINYEQEDDEKENAKAIKQFVTEHKVPYPCLVGDSKTQDQVPNFEGFPTTLFLDRSGSVRAKLVGFNPSGSGVLKVLVETLLAEEAPKP